MQLDFSDDERHFRDRVRTWVHENKPTEKRPPRGAAMRDFDLSWQQAKHAAGFGAVTWPQEFGGAGLSLVEQLIWFEELGRAGAPSVGCLSTALNHAGPTLIACGTHAQKSFHLPRILGGEVVWSQGFSEPGAGSDLGALRIRADVDGDELVINGQKIWTSNAQLATYQETLVRTEAGVGKHKGITWCIVDMRSPGLDIRPLDTMAGDQHFSEVFYDDVRVPLSNVVGDVGDGWSVAMTTLAAERSAAGASHASQVASLVEELIRMAQTRRGSDGRLLIEDDEIAARLARCRADTAALRAMVYAVVARAERGSDPAAQAALLYLQFGELLQRVRATALDVLGGESLELDSGFESWTRGFLADRMYVIAGGSAEVRRNIIAQHNLGLPRSY